MKRAILTVGPQYAGKSTFCKKVIGAHPEAVHASRDEILIRMFGTVWLDRYSGGHYAAIAELWKIVERHFSESPDKVLLLDTWNGPPHERASIVKKLRTLGAERVDAWHFVTPLKTCVEWSFRRDPIEIKSKWSEIRKETRVEQYTSIYRAFAAFKLEDEGIFDSVRRINSIEPIPRNILE